MRILLVLWCTAVVSLANDSLEQRLIKRSLPTPDWEADTKTLAQLLATLSADYQARYHEPLPIYIAVELVQPLNPAKSEPEVPLPVIPGLKPNGKPDPNTTETHAGPFSMPVRELLRYYADLSGLSFTIRNDLVLFHATKTR